MFTNYDYLNRLLTLLDACQIDCDIELVSTEPESLSQFLDERGYIHMSQSSKNELIANMSKVLTDGAYYHYKLFHEGAVIAYGYDHCEINFIQRRYFSFHKEHLAILSEVEVCDMNTGDAPAHNTG